MTNPVKASDLLVRLRRRASCLALDHEETAGKGSHVKVRHDGARTVVPLHRGDLPTGTYRAILRQLGLSASDLED
ncbi:type II toxin-antitoxin system HicA family toxin [Lichenicoccus sp.]|uniref:type II toxin-antitoxin system HicA family toxin n=1 Tax=Lichenicoccus sp. TaxID=2781899 RepID=UPI003D0DC9CD